MADQDFDRRQVRWARRRIGSRLICAARMSALREFDAAGASWRRSGCSSTSPPTASSSRQRNLVLLALQTSIVSLAAISAVMLIVTRNFDLSVGSAVALVGVVLALLTGQARRHRRCSPCWLPSPPAC